VSISQFDAEVSQTAQGLIAIGVQPTENVLIMSETRYEWAVAESAIWYAGGVVVPVYDTSSVTQVKNILKDSGAAVAFAGSPEQSEKLLQAAHELSIELHIEQLDDQFVALKERGQGHYEELNARREIATQDDVATIVYTSGTTGEPKAALITHGNLLGQVLNIAAAYSDVIWEGGRTIIFLPLAHVLARGLQLVCLASGMTIAHLGDPKSVVPTLSELKPTFLVVVPRVLQKIHSAAGLAASEKRLSKLWKAADSCAVNWAKDLEQGRSHSLADRVKHKIFDRLFYSRLRKLMGGELKYLLSGAAALEPSLALFFRGIGVPVVEGYGLTETTAPLTGNLPGSERAGSVGVPIPGSSVRISPQGEVLAKGVGVFAGYKNPEHNADAFVDGYFRTGDIGLLDESGRLTLKGRLKDVIVTAGGKTITPAAWENLVENEPLVAHAVTVGEGKPYLSSLIVVDNETLASWALNAGERELLELVKTSQAGVVEIDNANLRSVLAQVIQRANEQFSRSEQVRKFTVLMTDLSAGSANITATLKLKRQSFVAQASAFIDQLYLEPDTKRLKK